MRRVLVTGFEPFDGDAINPSQDAARELDGRTILRRRVVGAVLPCAFGDALRELRRLIREHDPELVISVGQAGGRAAISLERVAINVDDARIPDNRGARPIDEPIARRGPVGYWSTLPIKAIVEDLGRARIKAEVSQTAGTFVCNHVFYGLMRALARRPGARGGFVHVPFVPAQARTSGKESRPPSMPMATIVRGLEVVIRTSLSERQDRLRSGGALH